jgi:hypothetical protein
MSDTTAFTAANLRAQPVPTFALVSVGGVYLMMLCVALWLDYRDAMPEYQERILKYWWGREDLHASVQRHNQFGVYIRRHHLWCSVFARPFGETFNSAERWTVVLASVLITLAVV